MNLNKKNLPDYLITLMLLKAGYEITLDEILETTEAKRYLDPNYKWYLEYTTTLQQNREWFVEAVELTKKIFNTTKGHAMSLVSELDLHQGLIIKG